MIDAKGGRFPNDWPAQLHIDLVAGDLVEALARQASPVAAQAAVGAVEVVTQGGGRTGVDQSADRVADTGAAAVAGVVRCRATGDGEAACAVSIATCHCNGGLGCYTRKRIAGATGRGRHAAQGVTGPVTHAADGDDRGGFVKLYRDDVASGAAVARLVADGLGSGTDCTAFAVQRFVGGATDHPGQVVVTGERHGHITVVPAVGIGGAARRRADGGGGGVPFDGHTLAGCAARAGGGTGEGVACGVGVDRHRVTAALAADDRFGIDHAPTEGHIADIPAVVAQRADYIGGDDWRGGVGGRVDGVGDADPGGAVTGHIGRPATGGGKVARAVAIAAAEAEGGLSRHTGECIRCAARRRGDSANFIGGAVAHASDGDQRSRLVHLDGVGDGALVERHIFTGSVEGQDPFTAAGEADRAVGAVDDGAGEGPVPVDGDICVVPPGSIGSRILAGVGGGRGGVYLHLISGRARVAGLVFAGGAEVDGAGAAADAAGGAVGRVDATDGP